jgi:hypothetical protein
MTKHKKIKIKLRTMRIVWGGGFFYIQKNIDSYLWWPNDGVLIRLFYMVLLGVGILCWFKLWVKFEVYIKGDEDRYNQLIKRASNFRMFRKTRRKREKLGNE